MEQGFYNKDGFELCQGHGNTGNRGICLGGHIL